MVELYRASISVPSGRALLVTVSGFFGDFDDAKFELTMKSRRYVSKHHPNDFQNKVLSKYEELRGNFVELHSEGLQKQGIKLWKYLSHIAISIS